MTEKEIIKRQTCENVPYEIALKIKELLADAKKSYPGNWDDDEVETKVAELVFED